MIIYNDYLNFFKEIKGVIHISLQEYEKRIDYLYNFNITDEDIIWIKESKNIKISEKEFDKYNFIFLDILEDENILIKNLSHILKHIDFIYISNSLLTKNIDKYLENNNFQSENNLLNLNNYGYKFYVKNTYYLYGNYEIYYGTEKIKKDIKDIILKNKNLSFKIPNNDEGRASLFGDPIFGEIKKIYISDDKNNFTIDKNIFLNLDVVNNVLYINKNHDIKEKLSLCFDIGANIGNWSLKNSNKYKKIIAVEASEITYEKLKKNVCNKNIEALNYAVCDSKESIVPFYECESDVLSTLNVNWLNENYSRFHNNYIVRMSKTISIDKLVETYGIPDLIKIDVESAEYECIKSMSVKNKMLCFEWASEFLDVVLNCLNYLFKLSYKEFFVQMNNDEYTFWPDQFYNINTTKQILSNTTPKQEWGMIWCK